MTLSKRESQVKLILDDKLTVFQLPEAKILLVLYMIRTVLYKSYKETSKSFSGRIE